MSLLNVVRDVCLAVGVNPPTSLFSPNVQPRTQGELLSLANEMAQRIAYDFREWTALKTLATHTGNGVADRFAMPSNYRRMLVTSQVYPSWAPRQPLRFIADADEWLMRRMSNMPAAFGEWTLIDTDMLVYPVMAGPIAAIPPDPITGNPGHAVVPAQSVTFAYLDKNCIKLFSGGNGDQFMNDADEFRIPERVLKLGMIWQWKANKGSPYAEDMGTYMDALLNISGSDKPAPILVDRQPISAGATVAYPWPVPTP